MKIISVINNIKKIIIYTYSIDTTSSLYRNERMRVA